MTALAWALLMPSGCSKENGSEETEGVKGELVTPELKADKEMVVYNDETVGYSYVMFSWDNASTGTMIPEYTLLVTKESDRSFANAKSFSCNRMNHPVSMQWPGLITRPLRHSLGRRRTPVDMYFCLRM